MKADLMDVALFVDHLENEKVYAASTVRAYGIMLSAFLERNPDIENSEDYNKFIIEKGIKKRSYYVYYVLLNYINFKFKKEKVIRDSITENLRKVSMPLNIKRERRNLDPEQILNIISNIKDEKHQIIALIQKLTGLRAGDVLRITKGNIKVEKYKKLEILRIAATGKRGKRLVVEIFDKVAQDVILNYIENPTESHHQDYYFLEYSTFKKNASNTYIKLYLNNYNRYWADLKQSLDGCGIMKEDFATHDFRRNFARKVWLKYKNLIILQKILGHNDPRTTTRYLNMEGLDLIEVHKEMQK